MGTVAPDSPKRQSGRVPIDRRRGGEHDPPDLVLARGVSHQLGGGDVEVKVLARILLARRHADERGEVHDALGLVLGHRRPDRPGLGDIALDQGEGVALFCLC